MSRQKSPLLQGADDEVTALIAALNKTERRLAELTAGEVDTVADHDGRAFLLRRSQEALRYSEAAKQAAILNSLPAYVALLDAQGLIISVNEAWRRFGKADAIQSPGHALGLNYLQICDGASGDGSLEAHQVAEGIRSVLSGKINSFSIQYPCHSPTEQRWFRLKVAPLADDHPKGAVVMHLDETAERQTEQRLHAGEWRFRQMAENIRDVFFLIEADSNRMLYISPAYEEIWGRSCESVYANPESLTEAIHPDDRASTDEKYKKGMSAGKFEYDYRIVRPDGSIRWIEVRGFPVRDDGGKLIRISGVAEDITERKQAAEELRESDRRFSDLLRNVDLVSVMLDREARITYCNEYLLRLTGWRYEEVIGRSWFELFIPAEADDWKARFGALLANLPEASHLDNEILTRSGERRLIRWNNSVLRSGSGDVIGTASIGEDITERKETEIKIRRLNRVYAVRSGINAAIVRIRDRRELFQEACRIIVEHGHFTLGWIAVLDHATGRVLAVAQAGLPESSGAGSAFFNGAVGLVPGGTAEVAIREKHSAINNAIDDESGFIAADHQSDTLKVRRAAVELGAKSVIVLPLVVEAETFGILTLYAPERNFFDEEEIKLLNELAGDISFGLEFIAKEEKADYLAYYDTLTGLANRSLLQDRLRQALNLAERYELNLAVVSIDLDRFKLVNDSLGHTAGDEILKAAASRLRACVRDIDTVARMGGDEFVVVLTGLEQNGPSALDVAQRMLDAFAKPVMVQERELFVSCSIGVALYPRDGDDEEMLLKNADAAMYQAKQLGRNNCRLYTIEAKAAGSERLTLETALRHALSRDELRLHYQPLVDLGTGCVIGLEALIRWQRSESELVSPALFIPLAEETGLIYPISEWVVENACAQNKAWQDEGLPPVYVAVNLSAHQFRKGNLIHQIESVLARTGLQHRYFQVELTESMLMQNIDAAIAVMSQLRELGVCISLDDFGTGYSSLSYLRRFPIDTLKIDQSFVREITSDANSAAIAYAIIAMAKSLRLPVLAEGVETEGQLALLRAKNCNMMQGYLFSKPLPPDGLAQLLREGRSLPRSALRAAGPALLLLDDEPHVLSALSRALRGQDYRVFTANTAKEAFELLAQNTFQVIVSDQRMSEMNGTEFFGRVKDLYPHSLRIMLSGYTELKAVTDAVNQGAVYKFVTKPWDDEELRLTIKEAFQRSAGH